MKNIETEAEEFKKHLEQLGYVKVIPCKDCKHHKVYETNGYTLMLCNRLRTTMADALKDSDYCSRGERR